MKVILSGTLLLISFASFAFSFKCCPFKAYRIGAPKTFMFEESKGDNRGKLVGMMTLDGSSVRKKPIYGDLSVFKENKYTYVRFDSDLSDDALGYMGESIYQIEISDDNENGYFDGMVSIAGRSTMLRCSKILDK